MNHRLHDGPPLRDVPLPLGPRQPKPEPLPRSASIAALSWAAERKGQSYGQFIIGLSTAEQHRIQAEFDAWKAEQTRAKEERMAAKNAKRVDTSNPIPEGYILTDNDL